MEEMTLSTKELIEYMKRFDNADEFTKGVNEDCHEFVRDVSTLTNSISNLYEASKIALAIGGIVVKIEVTGAGQQLFAGRIGDESSAGEIKEMMKRIVGED